MYTTYHLSSAQEVNSDILEAIKATFKSKPITIIVAEDLDEVTLSTDMKVVIDERLKEDESTYFSAKNSIDQLKEKYDI
ncbi:MAG: hypothetical protein Q4F57_02195 [Weeksellaceae bacterium]|nr:hypothetical protein [Weeksellaceae bacterium]